MGWLGWAGQASCGSGSRLVFVLRRAMYYILCSPWANERHFFPFPSLSIHTDFPTLTEARLPCRRSSFAALISSQEIEFSKPLEAIKPSFPVLYSFVRMWTLIKGKEKSILGVEKPRAHSASSSRPGKYWGFALKIWALVACKVLVGNAWGCCRAGSVPWVPEESVICWEGHLWSWPSLSVQVPDLEGIRNSISELPSAYIWGRVSKRQDQNPSSHMPFLGKLCCGEWIIIADKEARRKPCPYPT